MAGGETGSAAVRAVPGVRLSATAAGIREAGRRDLALIELAPGSRTAAVFTRNAFRAAPVAVAREHLGRAMPRAFLVNTGYANAGTGEGGRRAALDCCAAAAEALGCRAEEVLPFSTGIIGEDLPVRPIVEALPALAGDLSADGWLEAAGAIVTTDTRPKAASRGVTIRGERLTVTGVAKGAGMIRPDMATMLAFVATDAELPNGLTDELLRRAVARSFNRITVDGDTSTNDAVTLTATGASGIRIEAGSEEYAALSDALEEVCAALARAIVRDGEGASKLVTVDVTGAADQAEAERVAEAVAHSPLVKTALYAEDPNWGRILAAVGRAGAAELDISTVTVWLDEVRVVAAGRRDPDYREEAGRAVLARDELTIGIALGRGRCRAWLWTCDLSHDYVTINAEYRS